MLRKRPDIYNYNNFFKKYCVEKVLRCSDSKELESGWSPLGFVLVGWCLGDQGRSTWSEIRWSEDLIEKQLTFVQVIVLKCLLWHDVSRVEPSWLYMLEVASGQLLLWPAASSFCGQRPALMHRSDAKCWSHVTCTTLIGSIYSECLGPYPRLGSVRNKKTF